MSSVDFNGTTQYLSLASPSWTWTNYYLSLWFNPDSLHTANLWRYFGLAGFANYRMVIGITSAGNAYVEQIHSTLFSITGGTATTANSYTVGAWNHIMVRCYNATADRTIILNGGTQASDTTAAASVITPGTLYAATNNAASEWFDGRLGEVAEWDDDFTIPDLLNEVSMAAQLYSGQITAAHLRTEYLMRYYTWLGHYNSWVRGAQTFTAFNSPPYASGSALWQPWHTGGVSRPRRRIRTRNSSVLV